MNENLPSHDYLGETPNFVKRVTVSTYQKYSCFVWTQRERIENTRMIRCMTIMYAIVPLKVTYPPLHCLLVVLALQTKLLDISMISTFCISDDPHLTKH